MVQVFVALLLVEMVNAALLLWGPNLASPQALDERVSGHGAVAVNQVHAVAVAVAVALLLLLVAVVLLLLLVAAMALLLLLLHHALLVRCLFHVNSFSRLFP